MQTQTTETTRKQDFCWTLSDLQQAFSSVRAKNARGGIDRRSVQHYEEDLASNLAGLLQRLQSRTYVPDPYEQATIRKDNGGVRILSLATVEDKIVQFVVKEHLERRARSIFLDCSYAYRPGKGHGKAIARITHHLREDSIVLVCDIDNFFDSIDHPTLMAQLRNVIADEQIMRLLELWITTGSIRKGRLIKRTRGIPQGNVISPVLSNIYLTPFDRFMVSLGQPYVRYADNFIVCAQDRAPLDDVFLRSKEFLSSQLSLRLNEKAVPVYTHKQGFDFLGIHFCQGHRTMAERKFQKALMEITEMFARRKHETFDKLQEIWEQTLAGWRRYYGPYDVREQFNALQENLSGVLIADLVRRHSNKEFGSFYQLEQHVRALRPLLLDTRGWHDRIIRDVKSRYAAETAEKKSQSERVQRVRSARTRRFIHLYATEQDMVVSSPGSFVGKHQGKLQVKSGGTIVRECPARSLRGIMLGNHGVAISTDAIRLCVEQNVQMSIVDPLGRHVATITGGAWSQFALSAAQAQAASSKLGGTIALVYAAGKVKNQISLLRYYAKYHNQPGTPFGVSLAAELPRLTEVVARMRSLQYTTPEEYRSSLFGLEGQAGAAYWRCVRALIGPEWGFEHREHQGASNIVNKMLNYGYGVLSAKVFESVLRNGFNPTISFLHTPRANLPTLVFDIMEQFRPTFVDRVVITMLLRKEKIETEGELLARPLRDKLAERVLAKLRTEFTYRGKRQTPEEILESQLVNLAMFIQGKSTVFRSFAAKW